MADVLNVTERTVSGDSLPSELPIHEIWGSSRAARQSNGGEMAGCWHYPTGVRVEKEGFSDAKLSFCVNGDYK
jgi:hypothetical protein